MLEHTRKALRRDLRAAGLPFAEKEALAAHTTFHIGGAAAFWCMPKTADEVRETLVLCRKHGVKTCFLGKGSNTLFSDAGYDGAVLALCDLCGSIALQEDSQTPLLTVDAGCTLSRLCTEAQKRGLSGLEFACGIPGTVGGAVYMNAGAYGGEIKDVLHSVTFLDSALFERTLPAAELALGYRTSVFEKYPDWCVLSAVFRLTRGDNTVIAAQMREYLRRRKEKQPLEWPSAGSTFKRPEGAFAGRLIEECGLRGFAVGGAQISEKHCGFVINRGGATCADVIALTEQVKTIVREKTGYELEREIRVIEP